MAAPAPSGATITPGFRARSPRLWLRSLSAQIFEEALEQHPEIAGEIGRGEFGTLRGWLRENIHRHGGRYDPEELIERVTGRTLDTAPYLRYLQGKFGELYGL